MISIEVTFFVQYSKAGIENWKTVLDGILSNILTKESHLEWKFFRDRSKTIRSRSFELIFEGVESTSTSVKVGFTAEKIVDYQCNAKVTFGWFLVSSAGCRIRPEPDLDTFRALEYLKNF